MKSVIQPRLAATTRVHVVTDSLAFTDGVHQHVFEDTRDWMDEVFWARMYAGFHFYYSLPRSEMAAVSLLAIQLLAIQRARAVDFGSESLRTATN